MFVDPTQTYHESGVDAGKNDHDEGRLVIALSMYVRVVPENVYVIEVADEDVTLLIVMFDELELPVASLDAAALRTWCVLVPEETIPPIKAAFSPVGSTNITGLCIVYTNRLPLCNTAAVLLVMLCIFQNGSGWVNLPVLGLKCLARR